MSVSLLLLELLNVWAGHRKQYSGTLESQSDLPPSHLGHKIVDFMFLAYISFIIIAFRGFER